MAYQINYYGSRDMQKMSVDTDQIGDVLDKYPAPTGNEVAYARHSDNSTLDAYGYDGEWHSEPPVETVLADQAEAKEAEEREAAAKYSSQPHVKGFLSHDRNTFVVHVPGSGSAYISITDLRRAATQADPAGRDVYGRLLEEAEGFLASLAGE